MLKNYLSGYTPSLDRAVQRSNVFLNAKLGIRNDDTNSGKSAFFLKRCRKRTARFSAGYTMVEMIVVVSVMAMLTTILVVYNRTGQEQITLFKDQAKIINLILRAKSLAISTYTKGGAPCGYGVHFGVSGEVRIFKELDPNGENLACQNSDNIYSGSAEDLDTLEKLSAGLRFVEPLDATDIVFIPPEPLVIIDADPNKKGTFRIKIETLDGANSKTIKINNFGQVTTD